MVERSFCIVGPQGSGKSTASAHLREMFPNHVYLLSSGIWEEYAGRKMTHYEKTLFQKEVIRKHGEKFFVEMFLTRIKREIDANPGAEFIVDGIRSRDVFDALRNFFGGRMLFVGMTADESVRRARFEERDGEGSNFQDRERRDDEQFHVKDLVNLCDVVIVNNFDNKEELLRKLDSVIG